MRFDGFFILVLCIISFLPQTFTSALPVGRWNIIKKYSPATDKQRSQKTSPTFKKKNNQLMLEQFLSGATAKRPGPKVIHRILYWLTAIDAAQSVIRNYYVGAAGVPIPARTNAVYSKLFYFARLRPRLLYAVGALLRALQLCTPLVHVIDPTIGVGAGINLCAILVSSRWVKPLVLGWATTKFFWTWLGAAQVDNAFLPITLSIREWEKDARKKRENAKSNK